MKKYVWAARTTIVVAGAALLTKGVLPHEVLFGRAGTGALSRELLHNEESPIHQLADSLQEQPVEVVLPAPQAPQQPVVRSFQHAVKKGATFNSLWREIGGSSDDVTAVLDALKDSGVNAGSLRVGEELAVTHVDGEVVEVRKKQGENATVDVRDACVVVAG